MPNVLLTRKVRVLYPQGKEGESSVMPEQDKNMVRANAYISPDAERMLQELGVLLFPNRKRTDGLVLERAIRELYERVQRETTTEAKPD